MTNSIVGFPKRPARQRVKKTRRSQSEEKIPSVDDIAATTPNPPISLLATEESTKAEVESRGQRLASNLMEQRHENIGVIVSFLRLVILFFYATFLITVWCLIFSEAAFKQSLPVTGVVLVVMTGSIPTILSISLLVGLFANKEGAKDKEKDEKSGLPDLSTILKVFAEAAKHFK